MFKLVTLFSPASDMSPRKGQDRSLTQTTVHNKPRQDYVVQSPRPVDTSRTSQGHSTDSNRKNNPLIRTTEETATKAKELELSYDDDYDDVIINNNAVVETPDERSADAGHFHGYVKEPNYKRGTNADNVFVMKSVYNEGQVEERYNYECFFTTKQDIYGFVLVMIWCCIVLSVYYKTEGHSSTRSSQVKMFRVYFYELLSL